MKTIPAKSILQYVPKGNQSWFGIDYNMNLYRGCHHGCIYCDSRSECYQIEPFEQISLKDRAIEILIKELQSKRKKGVIGIGAMSDTYNKFEEHLKVTRQALELIEFYHFGVSIDTKSTLILRDKDILKRIEQAIVKITITTADDALAKQIEPYAASSGERFKAVLELSEAGIFTGILLMPVLPYITNQEENIRKIVHLAYLHKAKFIYAAFGVTLRDRQRDYYFQQLDKLFPGLKNKYITEYDYRYDCTVPNAKRLYNIFKQECEKYGILYKMEDIISAYKNKKMPYQLSLDI